MKLSAFLWLAFQTLILLTGCNADILSDILDALENAHDCESCHALLVPLQTLAHMGDDKFSNTFATICKALKLEDDDVCEGTFALQGPILAHSLRNFKVFGDTATKFCAAGFGLCNFPPVKPFKVPFPKNPPAHPKKFISTGKVPFNVVHFSDVHIDRGYIVGADANCTKNICCRNFPDHVGPIDEPAGPFGNHKCDSPPDLAGSMLDAINKLIPKTEFAIFTGDVVEGTTWLIKEKEATSDLRAWNAQMATEVEYPVYGAIGNHDTAPVNSFPRDTTRTKMDSQWVFDTQSAGWERWIQSSGADELDHISGSYGVVVPHTKLRIVSFNTQYMYKQNFWLYDSDTPQPDPNGIFAFIVSQLQAAEDAGQRAWLMGHIPAGKADFLHDQSNYFDQIVQRYKNTIAAQFYGHSHKDQFEIAYSDWSNQNAETADSIAFIAPALTPTSGNPAFKVYDVDPDTFEVLDAKVYMTNVSAKNFQKKPTWELYYSARESYGPLVGKLHHTDPLNASFWHKLTEVFEKNETAFQLWNTRISRGGAVTPCTGDCKNVTICDQRALRSENNCDAVSPGINLKRNTPILKPDYERDECEGGGIFRAFRDMLSGAITGEPGVSTEARDLIRQFKSSGGN